MVFYKFVASVESFCRSEMGVRSGFTYPVPTPSFQGIGTLLMVGSLH